MERKPSAQAAPDGLVFNIQPFSIQDGPGIRTTVFLSGCNLRCIWCHNPESWEVTSSLRFLAERCIGCGACFSVCPRGAHILEEGVHVLRRERCGNCGQCASHCYAGALELAGRRMTVEEVFSRIEADKGYFQNSGGGATFSGGECMLQPEFLAALLRRCHEAGIHTAVDTAGHVPYEWFRRVLPDTDLFLYDLKAASPEAHKALTGVDGALVWENLERLVDGGAAVIVRVPCIKGANWEELPLVAERLSGIAVPLVELLPYHRLGEAKFEQLGRQAAAFEVPSNEEMEKLAALFEQPDRIVRFVKQ